MKSISFAENKIGMVRVGKKWNPTLNKANEFNVVIKEDAVTIDSDKGLEYPKKGKCGIKRENLFGETVFDDVEYQYYADGDCYVYGNGVCNIYMIEEALPKQGD